MAALLLMMCQMMLQSMATSFVIDGNLFFKVLWNVYYVLDIFFLLFDFYWVICFCSDF